MEKLEVFGVHQEDVDSIVYENNSVVVFSTDGLTYRFEEKAQIPIITSSHEETDTFPNIESV